MFEAVEALIAEHAELERQLADPSIHADQAQARRVGRRYAELQRVVAAYPPGGRPATTSPRPGSCPPKTRASLSRPTDWRSSDEALEERLRLLLLPRDPLEDKNVLLEVKAGEGGEESALFAGDLLRMYLRFAERRGWRTEITGGRRVRSRWHQERDAGGEGQGLRRRRRGIGRTRRHALLAAEVRRRRAPGPAGARHRVAGSHPHLCGGRAGAAGGRGRRHRAGGQRPPHRRVPVVRARRAERQHHRLRGSDHARAHRHRGLVPEREKPAAEQGTGPPHPSVAAVGDRPGARRQGGRPPPGAARCARSTGPSGSVRTTFRRTASPTTGSGSRPTTSTRSSTVISRR